MNVAKIELLMVCLLTTFLLCLATGAFAQSAAPVPSSYTSAYSGNNNALDTFITSLDNRPQSPSYSARLGSGLDEADGGQGLNLLQSGAINPVIEQLNRFQELGIQAVTISIGFPTLCPEFWSQKMNNAQGYNTVLAFYKQVMQQCRNRRMRVLVEDHIVYSGAGNYGQASYAFTSTLSASAFQQLKAAETYTVASQLAPDVISIVAEPDTDLGWSGQSAYKTAQNLQAFVIAMANAITSANASSHAGVVSAAGADSWMSDALTYDNLFCQIPNLGAIDIHTYFAGGNDLEFMTKLADSAHAALKTVVVSECWLSKVGNVQPVPSAPEGPGQAVAARAINSFSFWEPLDEKFISALVKWCRVENPQIFIFYYPQQLFAYLDYNTQPLSNDAQIVTNEMQAKLAAMNANQFSSVGSYYAQVLHSQTTAPIPPSGPPASPPAAARPGHSAPPGSQPSPQPPIVVHPSPPLTPVHGNHG